MIINDKKYEVIKNEKEGLDEEVLKEKLTDYYDGFDYVVGDWAYGKLRLKGFNEKKNKNFKPYNDYSKVEQYLNDKCAYGCRYFIIKKVEKE
jgi:uncharacterized protein YutD